MPIKFLNVPGSTNLRTSRPTGYKFPVGLSTPPDPSVNFLVVAGGGGGGFHQAGGGGAGGLRSTVSNTGGGGSLESALSLPLTSS